MNSFYLACSAVAPLVIYMGTGMFIRMAGIFTRDNFRALNKVNFRVLIAISLFVSIYNADLSESINPGLFLFLFISILATGIAAWYIVGISEKNIRDRVTVTQGIFRSNYLLYGGVIAAALCNEQGQALVGAASMVAVTTVNVMGVVLYELCRGGEIKPGKLIVGVFTNPLIAAAILAVVMGIFHIRLPEVVYSPVSKLGAAATPISMVTLGGILSAGAIKRDFKNVMIACAGRLIVLPAILIPIGILLGYRQDAMVVILAAAGCPTAVASAAMAQEMGGNGDLANEIVAVTSVLSIFTMFIIIVILSGAGIIG